MDDFVAFPSRRKIVLILLGCLVFVGLGLWMAGPIGTPPASSGHRASFVHIMGWVAVSFFGLCTALWTTRLFDRRDQLRIGPQGLRSAPWSERTIPWTDITDVTTWSLNGQTTIVLHLSDPARFPGRGLAALLAKANRGFTGGDISISLTGTDRTTEEALRAIDHFRHDMSAGAAN